MKKTELASKALTLGLCAAMALSAGVPAFAAPADAQRSADVNVFIEGTGVDDEMNVTDPTYTDVTYGSVMLLTFKTQGEDAGKIDSSNLLIRNNTQSNNMDATFSIAPQTIKVLDKEASNLEEATYKDLTYNLVAEDGVVAEAEENNVFLAGSLYEGVDRSGVEQAGDAFNVDGSGKDAYELVTDHQYAFVIDGLHDKVATTKNGTFQQAPFELTIDIVRGAEHGVAVEGAEDTYIQENELNEDGSIKVEGSIVDDAGDVIGG